MAIPEHKVALAGGGRESQCDVFALLRAAAETLACAIEAKVNEPFGPTKMERMGFICDLLGVGASPPSDLRYQLSHRTAAAVIEARRFKTDWAAIVVHSFSQDQRWFEVFAAFAALFGLDAERDRGWTCSLPTGPPLTLGWAVGSAEIF